RSRPSGGARREPGPATRNGAKPRHSAVSPPSRSSSNGLRVAAAGLKFSTAFVGIGLTADSGLSASLAHAVGVSRATELLLLNETFTAEDAANWGLVRSVVPAEEVLPAALDLARRLAAGPTKAYAEVKRALRMGAVSALPEVLAAEGAAQTRLAATEDHVSAVADFLAKRRPTFQGK
ncbi:MAG: 2-(1,2-epoxy,2-dihydrophenyl)acetyl-CoA isomerase, partial [Pseudonocardiales bacterium]|nr:2-(1,2-epoxy,2-dihydrophenyl)acetyl-CoA isomerase [Pseudonocardiales bacterium]